MIDTVHLLGSASKDDAQVFIEHDMAIVFISAHSIRFLAMAVSRLKGATPGHIREHPGV